MVGHLATQRLPFLKTHLARYLRAGGTCTQYSVDFCLAWALIGEWTSRILFPVPKGPWPRHGHAGALLRRYQARSPRIVAWARATFEQGALPSLLFLQGLVPIFTLPGDKMFQATELCSHKQRPPIMHAYGVEDDISILCPVASIHNSTDIWYSEFCIA